ncbi:tyrosine-type recombinase/integrase [Marinobacter nauticus]
MIPMDSIWEDFLALELEPGARQVAEELRAFLLRSELGGAEILSGRSEKVFEAGLMWPLEKGIHETLGRSSDVRFGKLLRAFVEFANRVGERDFPLPAVPILLEPHRSVFQSFHPVEAERAERWRLSLIDWIETVSVSDLKPHLGVGALIVSAALNSGLVDSGALHKLLQSIPEKLTVLAGRAYLDLELPWRGSESLERRRWFPDPVSEMIFLQLKPEENEPLGHKTPAKALWPFLRLWFKLCKGVENPPKNFSDFMIASRALTYHELPVNIGTYMAREHVSHSLRPEVWQRLHGVYSTASPTGDNIERQCDEQTTSETGAFQEAVETFEWAQALWEILKGSDRELVAQKLRNLLEDGQHVISRSECMLAAWALHMCTKPAASGKRLALSTIRQYVRQTGTRLSALAGDGDISNYDIAEFEELYTEVLADAQSPGFRNQLSVGLREFHHFLTHNYGVPKLSEVMNLGGGSILHPVDANLITLDDYQEIRRRIRDAELELIAPDLPTIVELIFVLGFRCGLRRMEALMLRIEDIHLMGRSAIIVRRYAGHRLKTANAKRQIPIYALLDAGERSLLEAWMEYRRSEEQERPSTSALFAVPSRGWGQVRQEKVMPILHQLMREVTGDQSLRYHHLRHSFASWTFLRLILAHHGKRTTLFPDQPITDEWLDQSSEFAEQLLKARHRPDLYAVARLLGHSGPDMSLEHYVHTMDLAGLAVDERRNMFEDKTLAAASGVPISSAYRLLRNAGIQGLLGRVRNSYRHRANVLRPTEKPSAKAEPEHQRFRDRLMLIEKYLKFRHRTSIEQDVLAERLGLSVEACQLLEERSTYLAGLRSNALRTQTSRHRFSKIEENEGRGDSIRLHTEPRTRSSKAFFDSLLDRVEALLHDNSDLVWEVVEYYIHNQWKTATSLIFRDPQKPEMAKKYLQFLESLGFPRRSLSLTNRDVRDRSPYRALWKKQLGLTYRDTIKIRAPANKHRKVEARWLFIGLDFVNDSERDQSRSFGFRYFMVMLAMAAPVFRPEQTVGDAHEQLMWASSDKSSEPGVVPAA